MQLLRIRIILVVAGSRHLCPPPPPPRPTTADPSGRGIGPRDAIVTDATERIEIGAKPADRHRAVKSAGGSKTPTSAIAIGAAREGRMMREVRVMVVDHPATVPIR